MNPTIKSFKKATLFLFLMLFTSCAFSNEKVLSNDVKNFVDASSENIVLITQKKDLINYNYADVSTFNNEFASQLYKNGDFLIYANRKMTTNEGCILFFTFYSTAQCNRQEFKKAFKNHYNKFFTPIGNIAHDYFNHFIIYHELGHFLLKDQNLTYQQQEFKSDLIAISLLWHFYDVDYRNEAYWIRKINYHSKNDYQRAYYPHLKQWELKKDEPYISKINRIDSYSKKKAISLPISVLGRTLIDFNKELFTYIYTNQEIKNLKKDIQKYNKSIINKNTLESFR